MTLAELCARWRADAATLQRRGCPDAARLLESCVTDLEEAERQRAAEEVTVAAAAEESGYSASQLRRLFPGRKRIPRAALPRKAQRQDSGPALADLAARCRRPS